MTSQQFAAASLQQQQAFLNSLSDDQALDYVEKFDDDRINTPIGNTGPWTRLALHLAFRWRRARIRQPDPRLA